MPSLFDNYAEMGTGQHGDKIIIRNVLRNVYFLGFPFLPNAVASCAGNKKNIVVLVNCIHTSRLTR